MTKRFSMESQTELRPCQPLKRHSRSASISSGSLKPRNGSSYPPTSGFSRHGLLLSKSSSNSRSASAATLESPSEVAILLPPTCRSRRDSWRSRVPRPLAPLPLLRAANGILGSWGAAIFKGTVSFEALGFFVFVFPFARNH